MKPLLIAISLFMFAGSRAQTDCLSEFTYQVMNNEHALKTYKGQFTVCYLGNYFSFIFPDGTQVGFQVENVNGGIDENGYTYTEFINAESHTITRGDYLVRITRGKMKIIDIQNTIAGIFYRIQSKKLFGQADVYTTTKIMPQDTVKKFNPIDTLPKGETLDLPKGTFYPLTIKQ